MRIDRLSLPLHRFLPSHIGQRGVSLPVTYVCCQIEPSIMRICVQRILADAASVFVKLPGTRCPHVNFACMCHTDVQNYPTNSPGGNKAMGDTQLFAKTPVPGCPGCGWATHFFPDARADMLLVLDDTWFIKPSFFENQWLLDPALVSQLRGMHSSVRPWH